MYEVIEHTDKQAEREFILHWIALADRDNALAFVRSAFTYKAAHSYNRSLRK